MGAEMSCQDARSCGEGVDKMCSERAGAASRGSVLKPCAVRAGEKAPMPDDHVPMPPTAKLRTPNRTAQAGSASDNYYMVEGEGGMPPQAWRHGPLLSPQKGPPPPQPQPQHPPHRDQEVAAMQGDELKASGWIQMSLTVSDMGISKWTQSRQDAFIETLAEATEVGLSDICVLFLREKCGKRLLSSAIEVTFQVKASSADHAAEIVRGAQSEDMDRLMMERGFRLQHALSRKMDTSASVTPRGTPGGGSLTARSTSNGPLSAPFRNGYSLTHKYESQLNGGGEEAPGGGDPDDKPSGSSTMLL